MRFPAGLAIPVEVRLLDTGPRPERVFRLARAIGEGGMRFVRGIPFEAGRPVRLSFVLPPMVDDDATAVTVTGVIEELPAAELRAAEARGEPLERNAIVAFTALDETAAVPIRRYIQERILLP